MTKSQLAIVAAASAAFTVLLAVATRPALAQQPEPQLRYFALPVFPSFDPPLPPELLFLVVHDNTISGNLEFCDNAPSDFLAGTQWRRSQTTVVTDRGAETGSVFWLDEPSDGGAPPPPSGAVGEAAIIDVFFVRLATGAGGECATDKFWVDDQPENSTLVLYVGVGLFSK